MNSLQDLIKRLSAIGQVNEAEEKCSECGCTPCECDDKEKVEEGKKPDFIDADKDGDKKEPMSDALKDKEEKVDESIAQGYDSVESNYGEWEGILEKDGYRDPDVSGARALDLVVGHQQGPDGFVSAIRSILTYVKQNSEVLGKAVADRKTVKDCIMDIKNKYPQYYQAAQQQGVEEGAMDKLKQLGKKALDTLGHKDDEELIKDMQKQQGQEPTGKKPEPVKENTTLAILRQLAGIKEAKIEEDDVEEGNDFSGALDAARKAGDEEFEVGGKKYKVTECGEEYPSSGEMSPMTMIGQEQPHMGIPAEVMAQMAGQEQGPETTQPEIAMAEPEAPMYTLTVRNGENNLTMTTDVPDEIMHVMKLAGVNKGAEVSKKEMPAGGEQEVEESGYENTPDNTKARDPQAHGDIRDWGRKGTANASTHYTPAKSGDNPMNEQRMFDDYKNFKAGK